MATQIPILAIQSEEKLYNADMLEELRTRLDNLNSVTVLTPIVDPDDVRISDDGTLSDGYRLSDLAFRQLCQKAAAGLSNLAADISGLRLSSNIVDEVISVPTAVRIINSCTKLRFRIRNGLMGRQLVRNTETKTIDGIVGPAYRYLPHIELFDAVTDMVTDAEQPAHFHEARLNGRWLSFAMRSVEPIFTLPTKHQFFSGYYFSNSEAGECSVSAGTVLSSDAFAGMCIGSIPGGGKLAHAGDSFYHRLAKLLAVAMLDTKTVAQVAQRAAQMQQSSLQLITDEGKYRKRKAVDIALILTAGSNIPRDVAADIVRHAVWTGAYRKEPLKQLIRHEVELRTVFDIFASMMLLSGQYHHRIRESIERAAYDLLLEKIKLVEE